MFIAHVLQEDYFLSLVTENLGMARATPLPPATPPPPPPALQLTSPALV